MIRLFFYKRQNDLTIAQSIKRTLFVAFGACILVFACIRLYLFANQPTTDAPTDLTEIDKGLELVPRNWNFGSTKETSLSKTFTVTNAHDSVVTLTEIQTTCGCTTAQLTVPQDIVPGNSIQVPVSVALPPEDAPGGGFRKAMKLYFKECGKATVYTIDISGVVLRNERLRAMPEFFDFGRFGSWESPSGEIALSAGSHRLEVSNITSTNGGVTLDGNRKGDPGVTLRGSCSEQMMPGRFSGTFEIHTNRGKLNIPFRGEKCDNIYCRQPILTIKGSGVGVSEFGLLRLYHDPKLRINCLSAECSVGDVTIDSLTTVNEGESQVRVCVKSRHNETSRRGPLNLVFENVPNPLTIDLIYIPFLGKQ